MSAPSFLQRLQGAIARFLLALPAALLRILAGRPIVVEGQTLDVQTQLMLKLQRLMGRDGLGGTTPEKERRNVDAECAMLAPIASDPLAVRETTVAGAIGPISARVYRPSACGNNAPAVVFYHGGGFVIGSLDSHDGVCRALADRARCVVFSIGYRLAPEHPAPAASDDAVAAFRDIAARAGEFDIDTQRLAVSGDSAGANLAAVVAQITRSDAIAPCFQLLFYPAVDFARDHDSTRTFARGFLLEKASMDWFKGHYIPAEFDDRDPHVSPIYGDLEGIAPAYVMTGGFDPLRDEGEAYADALRAAGVTVEAKRQSSMIHGFLNFAGASQGADSALTDGAQALIQTFAATRA